MGIPREKHPYRVADGLAPVSEEPLLAQLVNPPHEGRADPDLKEHHVGHTKKPSMRIACFKIKFRKVRPADNVQIRRYI
jgi:hypothetical protein